MRGQGGIFKVVVSVVYLCPFLCFCKLYDLLSMCVQVLIVVFLSGSSVFCWFEVLVGLHRRGKTTKHAKEVAKTTTSVKDAPLTTHFYRRAHNGVV